jgi:hypothetical protein
MHLSLLSRGLKALTFLGVLLGCTGCSHDDSPAFTPKDSLSTRLNRLHTSGHQEACEVDLRPLQNEVASALEKHEDTLKALEEVTTDSPDYRWVPMGPTRVGELKHPAPVVKGWQEHLVGWRKIHAYYLAIKDTPIDSDWLNVDARVKSILVRDEERVLGGRNYFLGKDSKAPLAHLNAQLGNCQNDPVCEKPSLDAKAQALIALIPFYRRFQSSLGIAKTLSDKRAVVGDWKAHVQADYDDRYGFRKNSTIARRGSELNLPLHPGPYSADRAKLAGYIESIWSGPKLKVKVEWKNSFLPELFEFKFLEQSGGRAYVTGSPPFIYFSLQIPERSIGHEIGHVLGFPDAYYLVWHPERCDYTLQTNAEDLMSDEDTGVIRDQEWNTLLGNYP